MRLISVIVVLVKNMSSQSSADGCPVGLFGPNCSLSCRHPNYGLDCQMECFCSKKLCDHATGCPSTDNYVPLVTDRELNITNMMYLSNLTHISTPEKRHDRSMWTYMGPMYKAMLVSICIFVVIFLAFCGIYFAVGRRKHAVVSYYCSNSKLTAEFPCYF
uniref:Uncharacterized protein LOC111105593 isoform X2 n=1 Tax=Crassostrea virginica TaxID=6565 RepID=A0A8B8AWP1_CRAVI|nr:uncharacterized protein LOC111105593 isoform X2 [Crassostrea virginica]